MSIQFYCPLGHALVVPDQRAGDEGRCPICHQRVVVPRLQSPEAQDRAISFEAMTPAETNSPLVPMRPVPMDELVTIPAQLSHPASPPEHLASTTAPATAGEGVDAPESGGGSMARKSLISASRSIRAPVPPSQAVPPSARTRAGVASTPRTRDEHETYSTGGTSSNAQRLPEPIFPTSPPSDSYAIRPALATPTTQAKPNSAGATAPASVKLGERFGPNGGSHPWQLRASKSEVQAELFINEGWPHTTYFVAAAMTIAAALGILPLLGRWSTGVMPQWVTLVVGLTIAELALAGWLASLPDWRTLNIAGVAAGLIAACYASGLAMIVTNVSANTLPLELFDVRNYAGGWCTGHAVCWGMISYALVRISRQWKRNLRRLLRPVGKTR